MSFENIIKPPNRLPFLGWGGVLLREQHDQFIGKGRGLGLKTNERGFKNKYEWLCRGKVDGFHFDGKSEDFETSK